MTTITSPRKMKISVKKQLELVKKNPWNILLFEKSCRKAQLYVFTQNYKILKELPKEDIYDEIFFMSL